MNDVQVGRFSALLHKLLGIREGSPAPTLAPELFAMLPVAQYQADWDFLQGVYAKVGYRSHAAVAAQFGHLEYVNPAGSGVIATFSHFINTGTTGNIYFRTYLGTLLGTPTLGANLDSRGPRWGDTVGQSSVIQMGSGTSGALLGTPAYLTPMTAGVRMAMPFVVVPGSTLLVICGTVNVVHGIAAWWSERKYEPSESR